MTKYVAPSRSEQKNENLYLYIIIQCRWKDDFFQHVIVLILITSYNTCLCVSKKILIGTLIYKYKEEDG